MLLNIKQLSQEDIDYKKLDFSVDVKKHNFISMLCDDFISNVVGECKREHGIIYMKYTCSFNVKYSCDRCLVIDSKCFSFDYEHIIDEKKIVHNEEYNVFLKGNLFNLDGLILSDIIVEFPYKLLCKDDCSGVCTQCGINKNSDDCNCKESSIDPRMEVLKQLLK